MNSSICSLSKLLEDNVGCVGHDAGLRTVAVAVLVDCIRAAVYSSPGTPVENDARAKAAGCRAWM